MELTPGTRLGPYEIVGPLGAGGMGEVHRARHVKLHRDVAIKVLPQDLAAHPEQLARFEREARSASALNHPGIVTIYDIAEQDGVTYIAMELVAGRTLRDLIADGPLPLAEAVRIALQVAEGLATAHGAGIVHRDVKPANLIVTPEGRVKILDFGLAKPVPLADRAGRTTSSLTATQDGLILGTPHYMSPEQFSGGAVDHRSDQFALGVVLYEMVTGAPPFDGPSLGAIFSAVLVDPPPPLRRARSDAPVALERILLRCLEKDPASRFPTTAALADALRGFERRQAALPRRLVRAARRPPVAAALSVLLLAAAGLGAAWWRGAPARWAERHAPAEVAALIDAGDLFGAYRTVLRAREYRPGDPALDALLDRITLPFRVNTAPPGAAVAVAAYGATDSAWMTLGTTPMEVRVPYQMMRWKIAKAGFEPFEGAPFSGEAIGALARGLVLDSAGKGPAGMVRVPGGPLTRIARLDPSPAAAVRTIDPYYMGRYEVTNRSFKDFVDRGGYDEPRWWPRLTSAGREVPWREGLARLRDATGRPGPAAWELGAYPAGQDEHPVTGISWFEAAAYCAWAGGTLPTVYHWFQAIGQEQRSEILLHSNVDGTAPAPVGRFRGMGAYGTYDMAGNVKEWVWNATGDLRYILGGSWNEPAYLFQHLIAQDPWSREPTHGVRCAQYPRPPAAALLAPVATLREYPVAPPISDEAFAVLRGLYAYDDIPLEARAERVNDSLPGYRRETVSIRTAYSDARMEIHLLMPRDAAPPYQSVIWFPGDDVFIHRSSERFASAWLFDFLPRAGRVVVYPVYRGMYERSEPFERTPNSWRNMVISWAQDIGRTIDYLETREDFDATKIAYYGFSAGALYAPVFSVVEPRLAAIMYLGGGLVPFPFHEAMTPAYFAPRVRTPTLMISGEADFLQPYEIAQRPWFAMIGLPDSLKRHARLPGGHIPSDTRDIMRETLAWLDRWLGPVRPAAQVAAVR